MEDYDRSLLLMRDALEQPGFDLRYQIENVGKNIAGSLRLENLTGNQLQLIKDCNQLDIELYEFAKDKLFSKYIKSHRGDLDVDVREFQESLKNFHYSTYSILTSGHLSRPISLICLPPWAALPAITTGENNVDISIYIPSIPHHRRGDGSAVGSGGRRRCHSRSLAPAREGGRCRGGCKHGTGWQGPDDQGPDTAHCTA